ncbi:MAG: 3-phosphoshikimate 1-carboxyvinyltransferase [Acidimicrobiia bacterium]
MTRSVTPIDHPVQAVVRPPGSKSFTNRALIVSALASGGASRLTDPLEADDTVAMRECLRGLGVLIDDVDDPWLVLGTGGRLTAPESPLDARASGTTARFVTAAAVLADGPVTIDGTARMRQRPMAHLLDALTVLGANVTSNGGYPPVTITPAPMHGGEVTIDGTASSQFVSALLMLAPMLDATTTIRLAGGEVVSRPYLTSTLEVMEAFGAQVEDLGDAFQVAPTGYRKAHYDIEADASAAAYPLVAAAITGGVVSIEGIPASSTQADLALVDVLETMGCTVERGATRIVLAATGRSLRGVDVDMNLAPDAVLALAVACLFSDGPSRIRNVGNLRIKETDRLLALETEIRRLGAGALVEGDDLLITPGPLHGAAIETYDDHRMAMSFALAGLRVPGVNIIDPGCVAKTWPSFFDVLDQM